MTGSTLTKTFVRGGASCLALAGAMIPAHASAETQAQWPTSPSAASATPMQDSPRNAAPAEDQASPSPSPIGDIIVTAQRRSESIQQIPIAVSSFTQQALLAQRIEGGPELVRGIPNVNFSKGFFSGFNFQIRGVGTQLGTAGGDSGVGIHLNNVPLTISRFFEADFYDVERVEVLRGPQGTLYGRNATGGVVNVVTAKPTGRFTADITGEIASYNSRKLRGMINVPLVGDRLALRVAGSYLKRDGYGVNSYTGDRINGRDLWSTRVSLAAKPVAGVEVGLLWQHFDEKDNRSRLGGTICTKDDGPATVGGVAVNDPIIRGYLSQGCRTDTSIYAPTRNQTPNSLATLVGYIAQNFGGLTNGDYSAADTVSRNLQDIESTRNPVYRAKNDIFIGNIGLELTPTLKLQSISSYFKDYLFSSADFQSSVPSVTFASTPLTPGGFYNDPQLGSFNRNVGEAINTQRSRQFSEELRLDSSFSGPLNFSFGGIYVDYKTTLHYYVHSNLFTYAAQFFNTNFFAQPNCAITSTTCIYIEPGSGFDNVGHNYFVSTSPYTLKSSGVFGEVYYKITDRLKLTVGGRYTVDKKKQVVLPVRLLSPGSGQAPGVVPVVAISNKEPTGRIALDWKPRVSFTDQTLIYGVVSRGYKAGGLNPPASFVLKPPYAPEFVNAIEAGTKNTMLSGMMTFNLTGFHYDYKDYQVAEIRDRTQEIQNINATVKGLELESSLEPMRGLRFNLAAGYLRSKIKSGAFVDPTNVTGGDPSLTLVRGPNSSTCSVNTAGLAAYLATLPTPQAFVNSVCPGLVPGLTPNLDGVKTSLVGRQLPNAPHWTLSAGAQYTARLGDDWRATLRGDYYWQSSSFARTYNRVADELRSYSNANATLTIDNANAGIQAQLFVKNVFNTQPVTNTFVTDQIQGLFRVGFVTDPRVYGISLTKRFGK